MTKQKISEIIRIYELIGHEKFNAELLKWLVSKRVFTMEQEVCPLSWGRLISQANLDEFRRSQKYDVIVFGAKHWLMYEKVDYQTARKACSAPCTRGDHWFLGFAIHGQFKNLGEGHKLECEKFLEDNCDCEEAVSDENNYTYRPKRLYNR